MSIPVANFLRNGASCDQVEGRTDASLLKLHNDDKYSVTCGRARSDFVGFRLSIAYIVAANINRRHMTKGQRAMAVAILAGSAPFPQSALSDRSLKSTQRSVLVSMKEFLSKLVPPPRFGYRLWPRFRIEDVALDEMLEFSDKR